MERHLTNDEAIELWDLGVAIYHKVGEDHDQKTCNCFRQQFGEAIQQKFYVPLRGSPIFREPGEKVDI